MSIYYKNYVDAHDKIKGYAIVKKGFHAYIHKHEEPEVYHFVMGTGKLYIDGEIKIVNSPQTVFIKGGQYHAMTAISDEVVLLYEFPRHGPFKSIKYTYLSSHL